MAVQGFFLLVLKDLLRGSAKKLLSNVLVYFRVVEPSSIR